MVYWCCMPFPDFSPSIPEFVRTRSERFGARPLILLRDERITYAQADERSARLARGLLAEGVGKGSRIGIWLPNGPDWIVAFLAATRIGAVAIPLNTFYKPRELGFVLRHADVERLLTLPRFLNADYLERLEAVAPSLATQKAGALRVRELPYLRDVFVFGRSPRAWARPVASLEATADANPAIDAAFLREVESCVTPADALVVIYSSGSTADPKGAVHTHGTLIRHAFNLNAFRDLRADDRIFSPMPFFWVGGLVFTLMAAMHTGAFMLCEEAFEPGETLALLERERATIVAGWPHYSKAMMEHPSFKSRDLSSIRSGNLYDILPPELRPKDPELRSNSLGMTETCGPHTIERMDVDRPEALRSSFGRSVPGTEHKIVDPADGRVLPPGELGEVCVRGYQLMQGLYKVEREDSFDRDGFYHTGDAGYFDADGVFLSRRGSGR
jgi:acyl-CoA synthetase (AMP-forming)/AMP-acid ligase II